MDKYFDLKIFKERVGTIGNNLIITGIVAAFFGEEVPSLVATIVLLVGLTLFFISILKGGQK